MPPQHKRNAPSEGDVPAPKKTKETTQLAAEMPTPTTLEDALKIIDMFKAEQSALVSHILKTGSGYLNASPIVSALLQQDEQGLSLLATAIREDMATKHSRLEDEMEAADFVRGAVTSGDLSSAMEPFVAAIEGLLNNNGDELTKLRLAYDLVFKLKDYSVDDPETYRSEGYRPSDEPADALLSDIIRRRRAAGDVWNWEKGLDELVYEARQYEAYAIEPWFPKSVAAFSELVAENASGENQPGV